MDPPIEKKINLMLDDNYIMSTMKEAISQNIK